MHQFINGNDAAFTALARRAMGVVVVFPNQALPFGATPARARVGVEIKPADGAAWLYVERGVSYAGDNAQVREWLQGGEMRFPCFADLQQWLRHELATAYRVRALTGGERQAAPHPAELTDLTAVRRNLRPAAAPPQLDEGGLWAALSRQVRGQDEALRTLSAHVCRHLARTQPRRPATFFAVGPTGVGKTKTAETLSDALHQMGVTMADYNCVRLDMSEYQESHRVSQLLGAPQGYIGYGEGAQLVDALAANPKTIILFDEIEKAHPNILRALMNALDAGRLSTPASTGQGREIDCRAAVFIFTSNLEAGDILRALEAQDAFSDAAQVDEVCRRRLRGAGIAPELVGRMRRFLVFRPLSESARAEIMTLAVARVAAEYGVQVARIAPAVIVSLLEQARASEFGARPDEYLVDELLGTAFAQAATQLNAGPVTVNGGPPFTCNPAIINT